MTMARRTLALWLAGAVGIIAATAVAVVALRYFGSCTTPPSAERVLAVLEGDPILDFRAAATTLESSRSEKAEACNVMGGTSSDGNWVFQTFSTTADPAVAVEAYRAPAEAAGWTLGLAACSRVERSMRLLLTKSVAGVDAQLDVRGSTPLPPGIRTIEVTLSDGHVAVKPREGEVVDDLHCVR